MYFLFNLNKKYCLVFFIFFKNSLLSGKRVQIGDQTVLFSSVRLFFIDKGFSNLTFINMKIVFDPVLEKYLGKNFLTLFWKNIWKISQIHA